MAGRQPGFFDVEDRLRELSAKGDDLERIAALVDFEHRARVKIGLANLAYNMKRFGWLSGRTAPG